MTGPLHFFLRRFFFALALAASTLSFDTATSLFASLSNAAHPLGFFSTVPSFRCSRPSGTASEVNQTLSFEASDCNPAVGHARAGDATGQLHFTIGRMITNRLQASSLESSHLRQSHESSPINTAEYAPRQTTGGKAANMHAKRRPGPSRS